MLARCLCKRQSLYQETFLRCDAVVDAKTLRISQDGKKDSIFVIDNDDTTFVLSNLESTCLAKLQQKHPT